MKKFVSAVIVLAMTVLCVMPTFCVSVAAKNNYKEVFECEDLELLAGSEAYDCETASGGKAVKGVGNHEADAGKWAHIRLHDLEIPEEGEYEIDIYCSSKEERTFRVASSAEVATSDWLSTSDDTLYKVNTGDDKVFQKVTITKTLTEDDELLMIYSLYFLKDMDPAFGGGDENDTQWAPNFDKIVIRAKGVPSDDEDNKGDTTGDNNNTTDSNNKPEDNKNDKPVKTGDVSALLAILAAGAAACGGLKLRKK